MQALRLVRAARESLVVFTRDVGHGLLEISHNTLALLGLAVVALLLFATGRAELRHRAEAAAYDWLQARQEARTEHERPATVTLGAQAVESALVQQAAPAPVLDSRDLTQQQAAVAKWLARRYKVAPEPVGRLVHEAWQVGQRAGLDPTLILAIMAVESSFNPFAQSAVGAQGLMQVMTRVHDAKYRAFGGTIAAFDPVSNLRVGVQVLKECISRAGSLEAGLRHYVGSANVAENNGYAGKVLAEQSNLKLVADGKGVPVNAPIVVPSAREAVAPPTPAASEADESPADDAQVAYHHTAGPAVSLR